MRRCFILLVFVWSAGFVQAAQPEKKMDASIKKLAFGKTADGTAVDLYVLDNGKNMRAKIITYGGIVTELEVPDRHGKMGDVVLGFDRLDDYLAGHPYFGAIVGRVGNRIAGGKFTLDGKEYTLFKHDGRHSLHGGKKGFDKVIWTAKPVVRDTGEVSLELAYKSADGEEGFPGNLSVEVTYSLTPANELSITYRATTDKPTPVNLTQHNYYNLAGTAAGDVLGHEVFIDADRYTPSDEMLIPTGEIKPVKGTLLDFTKPALIGARIAQLKTDPVGYDHNYVLNHPGKDKAPCARVYEPKSGRVMEVLTTEPGLQLYTGNFLDGKLKGRGGIVYKQYTGFCLEAQHFPDAVHQPTFPSIILRPGQTYRQTTVYRFSVKKDA